MKCKFFSLFNLCDIFLFLTRRVKDIIIYLVERVIKRYSNRKLYDTTISRYVTLEDITKMIMEGEDVRVIDNDTGKDLSGITLAQIFFEELKKKKGLTSLTALKNLIRMSGGSLTTLLEELFATGYPILEDLRGRGKKKLDDLYRWIDKNIEERLNSITGISEIKKEFSELKSKVEQLETELKKLKRKK